MAALWVFSRGKKDFDKETLFLLSFLFCAWNISQDLFNIRTANSDFNFHPKCRQLKISHLAFADDVMLFARGDPTSVFILMDCVSSFGSVSGLQGNAFKSSLYTAGWNKGAVP
ncbi:Uncharacterized protein Adt_35188 [Abeliophyllum distichum]|uniref:Reverse transcriptase domain-containing protein n=1 Tax=Abeliophyllum distichum TaxID=126358 RepID=A0ABD1QE07_9LAMI